MSQFEIFYEITCHTCEPTALSFALHRRKIDHILPPCNSASRTMLEN